MNENTIYCGDAIKLLESWPAGGVDLIFADPPYNIGYIYDGYRDDRPDSEYVEWSRAWMSACRDALSETGSFFLAIGDDFAAELCVAGKALGFALRNWIVWHYTFGQNMKRKFSRAHTHLLYFTKDPKRFTFNDHLLRFPSARHTEYQDLRASPKGRLPDDVWDDIPRVCGTFKERDGYHGCQLPEALLMRVIMAASHPGDLVLDPFVGSGTTVAVAKRLGRRYIGIDLSQAYVARTEQRLAKSHDQTADTPQNGEWPALHTDHLAQIYGETKVSLANLLPNEVALRVIAGSLQARSGWAYSVDDVREKLEALGGLSGGLPKLPNDTPYKARKHVTTEGKKYKRRIARVRGRSKGTASTATLFPQAQSA